jgi:hypothetical protein
MSRMKKGIIERGATNPPEYFESKGKEVSGRKISPAAQRNSQIESKLILNRFDETFTQIS